MSEQTRFDGILMSIIQQKGNIDSFFDTIFGFLRRNTDFFSNQKRAEEIIVNTCKANYDKFTAETKAKEKEEQRRRQEAELKKKAKEQQAKKQAENALKKQQQPVKVEKPTETKPATAEKQPNAASGEKKEEENEPAPKGNGGRTEKYIWVQTLEVLFR